MNLFVLDGFSLKPTVDALSVPEIKAWFDKDYDLGIRNITYVYHMVDVQSMFETFSDKVRHSKVCDYIFKSENYEPDDDVLYVMEMYKDIQENANPSLGLFRSTQSAIYKFKDFYDNIDFDAVNMKGDPRYKPNDVAMAMAKVPALIKTFQDLHKTILKEDMTTKKTRGERAINHFEK